MLNSIAAEALSPLALYRLIDCLDASDSEQHHHLREWSHHPVGWVAGRALRALAKFPSRNEIVLNERLKQETRRPVLVALLKTLLTVEGPSFEDGLASLLARDENSAVVFYAATLLKQRSPKRLEELAANEPYLRKIIERVSVDSPGERDG